MTPELELVRCGCGLVRNADEDALAPLAAVVLFRMVERHPDWELPRACRGCGAVYVLPRPQLPSSTV